jgi:erythromycin esterase-like protein
LWPRQLNPNHATKISVAACRRLIRFRFAVFVVICAFLACPSQAASPASEVTNIGSVVRDMCGKRVALIGESPVHGFGKTLEFKVELVRRLVDECHYDAVFFESGIYDFLNIQEHVKSGHDVTDSMIAAAIGGIWANKEVQPLIPFLRQKVTSGGVYPGGLDDQLGRDTWAQREMPAALAAYLPGDQKARCLAILQKHTLWQYTSDAPYGPQDKARILGCLDSIDAQLSETSAPSRADDLAMIDSLKRQFDRDFQNVPAGMDETTLGWNERDRSMYLNFRWLQSQLPRHSKVIVWAATVHVAKELSSVPGDESRIPLGFYIHRDFKSRAFALGFSAYSGRYAMVGQPVRPLSAAPQGSLEGRSFAGRDGDTVYLSRSELRTTGSIAARPLGTNFTTARWDKVLDGLVIFRREQAPEYLRH